jgi:hypothetical protein
MAVHEEQAVPATPSERQRGAQEDAAIPTQYKRETSGIERIADPIGERDAERADAAGVEHAGGWIPPRVATGYRDSPRVDDVIDPLEQTGFAEGPG